MFRVNVKSMAVLSIMILAAFSLNAQEFEIAVGTDSTFCSGAAFGGENFLLCLSGNSVSSKAVNAQLISYPGSLVGERITLNSEGKWPAAAFDGTNYLLIWCELTGELKGQYINTSGNLTGSPFSISTDVSIEREMTYKIIYGSNSFLAVFVKTDEHLYGQMIDKSGNLIGAEFQISNNYSREVSIAFDGSNYLVAWVVVIAERDKDISGQFVSSTGSLVGSNFVIDNGPYYSDNPTSLAFDGTRYLLTFHEAPDYDSPWTLAGSFITTAGIVQDPFTICEPINDPMIPWVAFDGTNYFITWTQFSNGSLMGRFFDKDGVAVSEPAVIFESSGEKIPMGGVGFGGSHYAVFASKIDSTLSDGDVYGRFVDMLSGIESVGPIPEKFELEQNYPNPFNPVTQIKFALPEESKVNLTIYNAAGQKVSEINSSLFAGTHSVEFDGSSLNSGIYYYTLEANGMSLTRKMILMK